jgi:hypothetical protein
MPHRSKPSTTAWAPVLLEVEAGVLVAADMIQDCQNCQRLIIARIAKPLIIHPPILAVLGNFADFGNL